MNDGMKMFH